MLPVPSKGVQRREAHTFSLWISTHENKGKAGKEMELMLVSGWGVPVGVDGVEGDVQLIVELGGNSIGRRGTPDALLLSWSEGVVRMGG